MAESLLFDMVWVDDLSNLQEVTKTISKEPRIALDCEGYNLGRTGTLDIITIATPNNKVYLFDITTMGQDAFCGGFKDLLESDRCEKLVFDCRNDADILWHSHQVKLGNVLDLQLLDVEHRRVKNPKQPLPETKSGLYWKIVGDNVDRLWGYKKCLEEYLEDPALVSIKDKGTKEMLDNKTEKKNVWADRPLTDSLKEYCAVDTQAMFPLFDILSSGKDLQLVKAASGRYADHRRSYVTLPSNNNYTFHAFLPHHILDVDSSYNGTGCKGCEKMFGREEFSKTQLNKGAQLCRVCRRVKQEVDTAWSVVKSRLNNRSSCYNNYSDEYMDFSSSDSWKC